MERHLFVRSLKRQCPLEATRKNLSERRRQRGRAQNLTRRGQDRAWLLRRRFRTSESWTKSDPCWKEAVGGEGERDAQCCNRRSSFLPQARGRSFRDFAREGTMTKPFSLSDWGGQSASENPRRRCREKRGEISLRGRRAEKLAKGGKKVHRSQFFITPPGVIISAR